MKKKNIIEKNDILFCQLRKLVFNQSSPLHPVSDFRVGTLSDTKDGQGPETLVSNLGFMLVLFAEVIYFAQHFPEAILSPFESSKIRVETN